MLSIECRLVKDDLPCNFSVNHSYYRNILRGSGGVKIPFDKLRCQYIHASPSSTKQQKYRGQSTTTNPHHGWSAFLGRTNLG